MNVSEDLHDRDDSRCAACRESIRQRLIEEGSADIPVRLVRTPHAWGASPILRNQNNPGLRSADIPVRPGGENTRQQPGGSTTTAADAREQHLATCAGCREYEATVRSLVSNLGAMAEESAGVSPSAEFHQRWTSAVRRTLPAEPAPSARQPALASVAGSLASWLRRSWRPALGLGFVWLLIGVAQFTAPETRHIEIGRTGWGPVRFAHFLASDTQSIRDIQSRL